MTPGLKKLQAVLKKRQSAFATQLADDVKCSTPTVYRRIEALKNLGAVIVEVLPRGPFKKTGPVAKKFVLVKEAP